MKKLFCLLVVISLLLCSCDRQDFEATTVSNTTTYAETAEETASHYPPANPASDFSYKENEEGGITILNYKGDDTSFVVPPQIDGKDVTEIWFRNLIPDFVNDTIVSVTLPDTIKSIGNTTFQNYIKLESINLPDSLSHIGNHAFAYCSSLKNISIPGKAINEYSWNAFMYSGLENVEIRGEVETLASGMFGGTKIKEFVCPPTLKTIEFQVFSGCEDLEKLTLNEGLVTVESDLLSRTKVKEITIPSSVKNISELAFNNAQMLEKVIFSGDAPLDFLDAISAYSVSYTVYFNEDAKGFTYPRWNGYPTEILGKEQPRPIIGDYEFEENENGVTVLKYLGNDTHVIIPEQINGKNVTKIGLAAFIYNSTVEYVKIPDSVISIGARAFESCSSLATVELSSNLEAIEASAFFACSKLEDITLPDTLTKIGDTAFSNCTSLTSINLPESITEMGIGVFYFSGIKE